MHQSTTIIYVCGLIHLKQLAKISGQLSIYNKFTHCTHLMYDLINNLSIRQLDHEYTIYSIDKGVQETVHCVMYMIFICDHLKDTLIDITCTHTQRLNTCPELASCRSSAAGSRSNARPKSPRTHCPVSCFMRIFAVFTSR